MLLKKNPATNRSFNRENLHILIVMITVKQLQKQQQISRRDGDERRTNYKGNGPSKACNRYEYHCTKEFDASNWVLNELVSWWVILDRSLCSSANETKIINA
ncbi:hypothetical protein CUMW_181280 [Citrus unshiu]|nr:hypothetical protein CUMW_181280 [Citrus unshiu]